MTPRNKPPHIEISQDDYGDLFARYGMGEVNDWGPGWFEFISIEEHEQLLAEARTKAFNEAADSVEMIVGESDGHGISTKEVWERAQSIRNKK